MTKDTNVKEHPIRVLVIEDEFEIREILVSGLSTAGLVVDALENGRDILQHLERLHPDVILMDQMMPGKSGQELIQEIRSDMKFYRIPIIMVTGLNSEDQKISALNSGADDYVTKPYSLKELTARVFAVVRRCRSTQQSQMKNISLKDLLVDLSAHKVMLKGQEIALTLTEFKILCELIKQSGQVLSRDSLRERALGNLNVTDRTIDVHMASLRKKLEHMGDSIETVRGVGYRMAV